MSEKKSCWNCSDGYTNPNRAMRHVRKCKLGLNHDSKDDLNPKDIGPTCKAFGAISEGATTVIVSDKDALARVSKMIHQESRDA